MKLDLSYIVEINVLLGLCLGSFFHVVLLRIKNEERLFTGRSKCDECHCRLGWYDLIPILSYCILLGKCRKCKVQISNSHLYAEIIFAVGFGIIGWLIPYSSTINTFMMYIAIVGLGIGAVSDYAEGMVYTLITDICILCVFILNLYTKIETRRYEAVAIYLLTFSLATGIAILIAFIDKEKHLGYGDYDHLILIFLCAGGAGLLKCIFYGSLIGIVSYILKQHKSREIPFVPLLYYGYLITLIT